MLVNTEQKDLSTVDLAGVNSSEQHGGTMVHMISVVNAIWGLAPSS